MMGMELMDEQLILSEKNKPKIRQNWSIHEKAFQAKILIYWLKILKKNMGGLMVRLWVLLAQKLGLAELDGRQEMSI